MYVEGNLWVKKLSNNWWFRVYCCEIVLLVLEYEIFRIYMVLYKYVDKYVFLVVWMNRDNGFVSGDMLVVNVYFDEIFCLFFFFGVCLCRFEFVLLRICYSGSGLLC